MTYAPCPDGARRGWVYDGSDFRKCGDWATVPGAGGGGTVAEDSSDVDQVVREDPMPDGPSWWTDFIFGPDGQLFGGFGPGVGDRDKDGDGLVDDYTFQAEADLIQDAGEAVAQLPDQLGLVPPGGWGLWLAGGVILVALAVTR